MRVLLVNTSELKGGAAVATCRLVEALNNNGVKAKLLVGQKQTDALTVVQLPQSWRHRWHFLWERLTIFLRLRLRRDHLYAIDIANAGTDITRLPEFREADVIHLAWVNQGMLSLRGIQQILASGKPVVWTMHDLWPAAAICHLALGCEKFKTHCQQCAYLPGGGSPRDLSYRLFEKKKRVYSRGSIAFVACSKWLAREAAASALTHGHLVTDIPNPISTQVFSPSSKADARRACGLPADKRLVIFAAQYVSNVNKGMSYLLDACRIIAQRWPDVAQTMGLVVLGGQAADIESLTDLPVYPMGYVSDQHRMAQLYNASDLFVLPSLSENLPNTIMEAMACGVPCVGFNVGGIPEMIDHRRTGYVARLRDADDLAEGIRWILADADTDMLRHNAVQKVAQRYSQQAVAAKYFEVYTEAMARRVYKL